MAASGVGQFSINVKSNLRAFYGELTRSKQAMDELTKRKHQLQIDSSQLDKLRDKSQRIAAEMRELRQQKTEIKLGMKGDEVISKLKKELSGVNTGIDNINKKKLQIQANPKSVSDAEGMLRKLDSSLKTLQAKKITLQADLKGVDNTKDQLKELDKNIASLNRQKIEIDAEIQPIRTANTELYKVEQEIDRLKNKKIEVDGISFNQYMSGALGHMSDLSNTLSKISFAPLIKGAELAMDSIKGLAGVGHQLFSELESDLNMEKVFRQNQGLLGVDKKQTDAVYKELDKYADKTIYNSSEMLNTYNALFNSGADNADKLVKGLGAISATAADSKSAMQTMSLQFSQAMINGLQRTDFRLMSEATNGGLAVAFAQAGKNFEDFQQRLGVANEKEDPGVRKRLAAELEQVVLAAADNPAMNKLAETPKTIAQGLETVTASLVNIVRKGYAPLQKVGIKWLLKLSDDIGRIDKNKIIEFGNSLADFADEKLAKLYEFIKKTDFKKLWNSFSSGFGDSYKDLKKHFDKFKKLFERFFDIDTKNMDIYDFAEKLGEIIPKLFEYGIKFKEASILFKVGAAGFQILGALSKIKLPSFGLFGKGKAGTESGGVGMFEALAKGLGIVAGLAGTILVGAKALQEIGKIGDIGDLQPKMLAIAEAVAGMGVIAFVAGKIDEAIGNALKKGLVVVTGLAADVWLAAKALQEVGKIDSDFGSIQSKIGQIALSITEIGALALAVGTIMTTGVGAAVLGAGLLAILGIAATLYLTGQAVASISNLELDSEKIETNIGIIKNTIDQMKGISGDGKLLENIKKFVNSLLDSGIATNIVSIGNKLIDIQELKFNGDKLQGNIQVIKGFIDKLDDFNFDANPFPAIGKWFTSMFDNGIFGSIIKIGNKMMEMQKLTINTDAVTTNIKAIQTAITSIRDLYTGFDPDETEKKGSKKGGKNWLEQAGEWAGSIFKATPVGKVAGFVGDAAEVGSGGMKVAKTWTESSAIGNIVSVGESIKKIQNLGLNEKQATTQIGIIKTMLSILSDVITEENVKNMHGMSDALNKVVENLTEKFPPEFNDFGQLLAEKLNDGFKNKLNLQKVLSDKFTNLSTYGAVNVGLKIANAINNSLKSSLNIGDTIRNAISSALQEKYSTTIDVEINTKEKKKNSSSNKPKKNKGNSSSGGLISTKSGYQVELQDSPEKPLLDNGEYVIPKKIVSALGVPFLEKLRSGRISRTFAGLAQSVSNTTSNIVNNVYNNNTQNLNLYTTGNEDFVLQANRRFRKA